MTTSARRERQPLEHDAPRGRARSRPGRSATSTARARGRGGRRRTACRAVSGSAARSSRSGGLHAWTTSNAASRPSAARGGPCARAPARTRGRSPARHRSRARAGTGGSRPLRSFERLGVAVRALRADDRRPRIPRRRRRCDSCQTRRSSGTDRFSTRMSTRRDRSADTNPTVPRFGGLPRPRLRPRCPRLREVVEAEQGCAAVRAAALSRRGPPLRAPLLRPREEVRVEQPNAAATRQARARARSRRPHDEAWRVGDDRRRLSAAGRRSSDAKARARRTIS